MQDFMLPEEKEWSIWADDITQKCEEYFATDKETIENLLKVNFSRINAVEKRNRLSQILEAVLPYCNKFKDSTDDLTKRKVGQVLLSKLDYSQFKDEPIKSTYKRLRTLFSQMDKKGINAYKMIWCQVLTDSCMCTDSSNYKHKIYDANREFDNLFNALTNEKLFNLSKREIVDMFEKCSTLTVKVTPTKIKKVYDKFTSFIHFTYDYKNCYYYFTQQEIKDIIKINPTLLCDATENADNIALAYKYFLKKLDIYLKENISSLPKLSNIEAENFELNKTKKLRNYIKNNSSLLLLNVKSMGKKEIIIKFALGENYRSAFNKIFAPNNLILIKGLNEEKIASNALVNIKTLESYVGKEKTLNYLSKNFLMLAMDKENFKILLHKINEKGEIDKFLNTGRALFLRNGEFKVDDILKKLENNIFVEQFKLDEMNGRECVLKFIQIFMDDDEKVKENLFKLINEKRERNESGEIQLRKDIRCIGEKMKKLSAFLKDDRYPNENKYKAVYLLAQFVGRISHQRLSLAKECLMEKAINKEKQISQEIEQTLNNFRDIFNKKYHKVKKQYDNVGELFDKAMIELDNCFDDKKAISNLYQEEVVVPFVESLKNTFPEGDVQISLYQDNYNFIVNDMVLKRRINDLSNKVLMNAENNDINIKFQ